MLSTSAWCSMPRAVDALPWGSMSITRTLSPADARAAAMFTVVVVLPTPPFWLETVKIRVLFGFGQFAPDQPLTPTGLVGQLPRDGAGVINGIHDVLRSI